MKNTVLAVASLILPASLIMAGCGGGGGVSNAAPVAAVRTGAITFQVAWPNAERASNRVQSSPTNIKHLIPFSTQSIQVSVLDATTLTPLVSPVTLARTTEPIQRATIQGIRPGGVRVTADAFEAQNATGTLLATGFTDASVTVGLNTDVDVTLFPFSPPPPNLNAPTLTNIAANSGTQGAAVNVTLTGTNFAAGATVSVSGGTVTVSNVNVVSATQITATFTIAGNAATGARNVTVTVSSQTSNAVTFAVNPPANPLLATVAVGNGPGGVAVNPSTNRIYVTNNNSQTVSVIDGTSNTVVATVAVGTNPFGVAVNPTTNRIYVANIVSNTVSVIDGTNNTVVTTVAVGNSPFAVAVNPTTNRTYVANKFSKNVSVIDGAGNTVVATVTVGTIAGPEGVAVDPSTNRIYVANTNSNNVRVIDGTNNTVVATVAVGNSTVDVAVNPTTNRIYVPNGSNVSVIDGTNNTVVATVVVGNFPRGVAANPTTNRIYVTNPSSNTVSVIDGMNNTVVTTVAVGTNPIGVAVNPTTNRVYVANFGSNNVSVLDGSILMSRILRSFSAPAPPIRANPAPRAPGIRPSATKR